MNKQTQSEFIKMYCKNSRIAHKGLTEKRLNELGQFAVPCDCGEGDCNGWAMISRENFKSHVDLYIKLK